MKLEKHTYKYSHRNRQTDTDTMKNKREKSIKTFTSKIYQTTKIKERKTEKETLD